MISLSTLTKITHCSLHWPQQPKAVHHCCLNKVVAKVPKSTCLPNTPGPALVPIVIMATRGHELDKTHPGVEEQATGATYLVGLVD